MYKWPQGKVIRTINAILALIMAADLAHNGAWKYLGPYFEGQGGVRSLVSGLIFAAVAAIALFGGLAAVTFHKRSVDFLIEVEQEMTRVTWPSGRELMRSTVFIALMIVVLAAGILAVDFVNRNLLKFIFGVGES